MIENKFIRGTKVNSFKIMWSHKRAFFKLQEFSGNGTCLVFNDHSMAAPKSSTSKDPNWHIGYNIQHLGDIQCFKLVLDGDDDIYFCY